VGRGSSAPWGGPAAPWLCRRLALPIPARVPRRVARELMLRARPPANTTSWRWTSTGTGTSTAPATGCTGSISCRISPCCSASPLPQVSGSLALPGVPARLGSRELQDGRLSLAYRVSPTLHAWHCLCLVIVCTAAGGWYRGATRLVARQRATTPRRALRLLAYAAYERVREETRLQQLGGAERQRRRSHGSAGTCLEDQAQERVGDEVVLEGLVDKRGHLNSQYQTRFFALHRCGLIRYYKPCDVFQDIGGGHLKDGWRRHAKPQGTIRLRGASVTSDPVDANAM